MAEDIKVDSALDCKGLVCPEPIVKINMAIKSQKYGTVDSSGKYYESSYDYDARTGYAINPNTGQGDKYWSPYTNSLVGDDMRKQIDRENAQWSSNLPPINREDGGQTQLVQDPITGQTKAGEITPSVQISRVDKNPYASATGSVSLTGPSSNAPMSAQEYAGLLSRFNLSPIPETPANVTQARSDILGAYQPTAQETQYQTQVNTLQGQLDQLNAQERAGVGEIQNIPASSRFADVQMRQFQQGISKQKGDVLAQIETSQRSLGMETAKRQGILQRATTALGFAQSDYENQIKRIDQINANNLNIQDKVINYAFKLQDSQREAFSTILKNFGSTAQTYDQMTPQQQQGIANIAQQWGIDPQALIAGIDSQAHGNIVKQYKAQMDMQKTQLEMDKIKKDLNLPAKLDTSITEANGRKLLINNQTGGIIKDLGVADIVKPEIYKPPTSYQEWELAGKPTTYADWLKEQNIKAPTQAQQTVSEYAARIEQANPMIESLQDSIKNMNYISFAAQLKLPSAFQSKDIQQYMQAARNFINAKLRRESGAVIANSEFAEARQQYLPQAGDSDEVLISKKANRDLVYSALRKASGNAYQSVDELLKETGSKTILEGATSSGMKYKVIE